MNTALTREAALEALKKYNKEPFHILHALTVMYVLFTVMVGVRRLQSWLFMRIFMMMWQFLQRLY